jgi:pimeloyl-ACP methyl ester carboxylesterase
MLPDVRHPHRLSTSSRARRRFSQLMGGVSPVRSISAALFVVAMATAATVLRAYAPQSLALRGHPQTLHVYGPAGGDPIIVSSGDGGWIHLGPHVAQVLADQGFRVVGFDVKAYLASFTSGARTLRAEDEPTDYRLLAQFARAAGTRKPILVGVSEGAGLSVLAATDPVTKAEILGVVGLGLPDLNELGWRWRDSLIYLTHKMPSEPTFSAAAIAASVAPLPLAVIHSTHDEFVPLATVQNIMQRAADPKRLWIVNAADHRFSDNLTEFDQRLLESIAWVQASAPR